jgi:hypothetical protein
MGRTTRQSRVLRGFGKRGSLAIVANCSGPPTNPFLPGSVVGRPVSFGFPIPHCVCLMVKLEQVWDERISWVQSSGLTVDSGESDTADDFSSCRCSYQERRTILSIGTCIASSLG